MCSPIEQDEVEMVETMSHIHHNPPQMDDDDSRTLSPCDMMESNVKDEMFMNECRPQSPYATSHHMSTHTIRMPILEATIKAEPKVEVQRLLSPSSMTLLQECAATETVGTANQSRTFIPHQNSSKKNLDTIVEAIRHLEGGLFDIVEPDQEAPLALTNKPVVHEHHLQHQHQIHHQHTQQQHTQQIQFEMNPVLRFRTTSPNSSSATIVSQIHPHHHSINNRPGVIVVKQNS